jgi:hypothetical protein
MNMMMGAAAISKLNMPAQAASIPPIDPAIEAIAKHRQAAADHIAAINATDAAERRSEAFYEAEEHQTECCYRECDAADALATTIPTTFVGVAAVLQYVNEFEDKGEEWPGTDTTGPEGWHYQLRQAMARAVVSLMQRVAA